ncbi:MAG: porphobilinogen synthase [Vicinamibacteria bacterium]|jgi:porphobilinogen synthase|nr:porphobilinogen synthase [Vicinamibacteria bacterium]
MSFPLERMRRLRRSGRLRALVRETRLHPEQLIYPLFIVPGSGIRREIPSLPGCFHLSVDEAAKEGREVERLGIGGVLLFGLPESKDPLGSRAWADDGVVQQAVRRLRAECRELLVITDVCLCEYTSHGHCGLIEEGDVANDATLPLLARMAVSHALAGAHLVAPSDMMDGRVGSLRRALDEAGAGSAGILSYAAKYASAFYGPFREAADSAPQFGDRRGYQMDPANVREALREVRLDLEEGADIVMVKPALAYLDVIRAVRAQSDRPVAAYNVSGEYAMVKAAAARGWIDERRIVGEILTSIHRAGADIILTYHAKDFAAWQPSA